jgi:hypothetical protein
MSGLWFADASGALNYRVDGVHVWIVKRPDYCDRGHYMADVAGISSIDAQDGFPRYYMDLERAKAEMVDWVQWRLHQEAKK